MKHDEYRAEYEAEVRATWRLVGFQMVARAVVLILTVAALAVFGAPDGVEITLAVLAGALLGIGGMYLDPPWTP